MADDRLGRGTKEDASQTGPAMRGDNDQVNVAFFRHSNDLRGCLAMNNQLLDVEPRAFIAFGKFREFALGRVFELLGDVCDWNRLGHSRITDRRHNRLDHVDTDDRRPKPTRERSGIRKRVISTLAEIGG